MTLAALSNSNTPAQNTAAIIAAFPHVELPAGTYEVDPVTVMSGVVMRGPSIDGCTLKIASRTIANDPAFGGVINVHGTSGSLIEQVQLFDFTVDGNSAGLILSGSTDPLNVEAVSLSFARLCSATRVRVINAVSDGFDFDDSVDCYTTDVEAQLCGGFGIHNSLRSRALAHVNARAFSCGFAHQRGGFDVHGTAGVAAGDILFMGCRSSACYRGFLIGGEGSRVIACSDSGSQENGIRVTGVRNIVVGNTFQATAAGNAITLSGQSNTLQGNIGIGAAAGGLVAVSGATGNLVQGNLLHGNTGRGIQFNAGANGNNVSNNGASSNAAGNYQNSGSGNLWLGNI